MLSGISALEHPFGQYFLVLLVPQQPHSINQLQLYYSHGFLQQHRFPSTDPKHVHLSPRVS